YSTNTFSNTNSLCNFFFFSSRRRHTRSKRDWSSDVCSSDLNIKQTFNQWNVTPKGIYFSSLVDPSVEHNQFPMIKDKLFSLFNMSRLDDKMRMDEAVQQVIQDHRQYLQQ